MQKLRLLFASRQAEMVDAYKSSILELLANLGQRLTLEQALLFESVDDICLRIESVANVRELRDTVAVVDIVQEGALPLFSDEGFPTIAEELVLRYPEAYFIFIVSSTQYRSLSTKCESVPSLKGREQILDRHFMQERDLEHLKLLLKQYIGGFSNLFDASLIRWGVGRLAVTSQGASRPKDGNPMIGVSIEDEPAQCSLSSYSLYRRGMGTYMVASGDEFERLFPRNNPPGTSEPSKIDVVLEDVELAFADREQWQMQELQLLPSDTARIVEVLQARADQRGRLGACGCRTILSVSARPRQNLGKLGWIQKPIGGIYDDELSQSLGCKPCDVLRDESAHIQNNQSVTVLQEKFAKLLKNF